MKKNVFFILFSVITLLVYGQSPINLTINGTVSDACNVALPGVLVKQTGKLTNRVVSDINGNYKIAVSKGDYLVFSCLGFEPYEVLVDSSIVLNVTMTENVNHLTEVVVTSLNIPRKKKSLGYAVQVVDGSELGTRPTNALSALSGRVAGLSAITSGGNMGGSLSLTLRGMNFISSTNQPLFVVDGVPFDNTDMNAPATAEGNIGKDMGGMIQDLNPDDIAEISFLKGAAAAALYGSRAANGVILVTTKKGSGNNNLMHIEINTGLELENIVRLPKRQKEYGGGYTLDFSTITLNGKEYKIPDYEANESWGPRLDGTPVLHWYNLDPEFKTDYLNPQPWAYPENDVSAYFRTGVSNTNNISLSKNWGKSHLQISYTNKNVLGTSPNASLDKNTLYLSGNLTQGILSAFSTVSYVNTRTMGRPWTGASESTFRSIMIDAFQWGQVQIDYKKLRDYKYADGSPRSWNRTSWEDTPAGRTSLYMENPYWSAYENYLEEDRNRLFGNIGLTLAPTSWLSVTGRINGDLYEYNYQDRVAYGTLEQSRYQEYMHNFKEFNYEVMASVNHSIGEDHSFNGILGANYMKRIRRVTDVQTVGGLLIPNYYSLHNASSLIVNPTSGLYQKALSSLFAAVSYGWKGMAYLDATIRNDKSSTLPAKNNSYFYPSFTSSFIASQLPALTSQKWLSFAKVRLGWAQVGNDTDPYLLTKTYQSLPAFGRYTGYILSSLLNNPNLKPERISSVETGLQLELFNNLVGLDVTYYNTNSYDQIIPLSTSDAFGYQRAIVNAGKVNNKGVEVILNVNPIQCQDLYWGMTVNFSKNTNELIKLTDELDVLTLSDTRFMLVAKEKESYGQIMGRDFVYAPNGEKVIDSKGLYMKTEQLVPLGSILPDFLWSFQNTVRYKNFNLGFLIDSRVGGHIAAHSYRAGMYSGVLAETAVNNIREEGIVNDGVLGDVTFNPDGTYQVTNMRPNDIRVSAQDWGYNHLMGPTAFSVLDATYIKLRELTLGYTFKLPQYKIKQLTVMAYARNVWNIYTNSHGLDPEFATGSGNIQGVEGGNVPTPLTYGVNLNIKF